MTILKINKPIEYISTEPSSVQAHCSGCATFIKEKINSVAHQTLTTLGSILKSSQRTLEKGIDFLNRRIENIHGLISYDMISHNDRFAYRKNAVTPLMFLMAFTLISAFTNNKAIALAQGINYLAISLLACSLLGLPSLKPLKNPQQLQKARDEIKNMNLTHAMNKFGLANIVKYELYTPSQFQHVYKNSIQEMSLTDMAYFHCKVKITLDKFDSKYSIQSPKEVISDYTQDISKLTNFEVIYLICNNLVPEGKKNEIQSRIVTFFQENKSKFSSRVLELYSIYNSDEGIEAFKRQWYPYAPLGRGQAVHDDNLKDFKGLERIYLMANQADSIEFQMIQSSIKNAKLLTSFYEEENRTKEANLNDEKKLDGIFEKYMFQSCWRLLDGGFSYKSVVEIEKKTSTED